MNDLSRATPPTVIALALFGVSLELAGLLLSFANWPPEERAYYKVMAVISSLSGFVPILMAWKATYPFSFRRR